MKLPKTTNVLALAILAAALLAIAPALADDGAVGDPTPDDPTLQRGEAYAHLMRSLFAAGRGEFRAAAAEIRKALEIAPQSVDAHLEAASLMRDMMGRNAEAEQLARRALAIEPGHPGATLLLGEILASRAFASQSRGKALQEALALYSDLEDRELLDASGLGSLVNLRALTGDLEGAIRTARQLVAKRPGDLQAVRLLFNLSLQAGDERAALEALLRYLSRHPAEQEFLMQADSLARKLSAWDLVAEILDGGEEGPRGAGIQALRGEALLHLGQLDLAVEALESALASAPTERGLRLRLALAYRMVGRLGDASEAARQLSEEQPGDSRLQLMLAEILEGQRDDEAALNSYSATLRILSAEQGEEALADRDAIRRRMASLYVRRDEIEMAERVLEGLEDPEAPNSLQRGAQVAIHKGDWTLARTYSRKLRSQGHAGEAAMLEGEILARTGRWSKAATRFDEALESLGPYVRDDIGRIYQELDRLVEAEAVLADWVELEPQRADAHFFLGQFQYSQNRFDEADASLRRAFALEVNHAPALNFLGYSLAERGQQLEEAAELIRRALQVNAWDGAYLDSLGWVYFQMGRYREALVPLERAAREYPKDPIILEHLGDLYLELGQSELALSAWTRALEGVPEDPERLQSKIDGQQAAPDAATESTAESSDDESDAPIEGHLNNPKPINQ